MMSRKKPEKPEAVKKPDFMKEAVPKPSGSILYFYRRVTPN